MLSVIVPFVKEWPQIAFTLRSIHEALDGIDHEVLAVDNLQDSMQADRASKNIPGMAEAWRKKSNGWLKYLVYADKLSHWQAKNFAMNEAKGDYFWFIDGHCICPGGSTMIRAYQYYQSNEEDLNGSLHLPLTYHILEPTQLMYKAVVEEEKGDYAYSFHTFYPREYLGIDAIKIPAMSTCGMLISREIMYKIGGWPKELGIYGGGEHFLNYVMAVLGMDKWLFNSKSLCHHGDKRGYNWNHYDYQRNRAIACFMYGDSYHLHKWVRSKAKMNGREKKNVVRDIEGTCSSHRDFISSHQVMEIEEWLDKWRKHPLVKVG